MEYPIWHLGALGGGFWIALIGTFHVFLAHFAVGGGLYLVLSEIYARRPAARCSWPTSRSTRASSCSSPWSRAASPAWASGSPSGSCRPRPPARSSRSSCTASPRSGCFFLGEIVALLVYYYGFDRMDPGDHLRMGWLYFLFALLSPGHHQRHRRLHAHPGPVARHAQFLARLLQPHLLAAAGAAHGHLACPWPGCSASSRPRASRRMAKSPASAWCAWPQPGPSCRFCSASARAGGTSRFCPRPRSRWSCCARRASPASSSISSSSPGGRPGRPGPGRQDAPAASASPWRCVVLLTGWGLIGSFEFVREAARKPYLIYDHTYSNGIRVGTEEAASAAGLSGHGQVGARARGHRKTDSPPGRSCSSTSAPAATPSAGP